MNEYKTILELFKEFQDNSPEKSKLPENVKLEDIEKLINKKLLEEDFVPPAHCKYEECEQPAEILLENDKIIVKCSVNPSHLAEISKDDYIVYRMDIGACLIVILNKIIGDFKVISKLSYGDFCKVKIEKDGKPIIFIFIIEKFITEQKLYDILSPHIKQKDFIVLVHKSTENNYENIDEILQKLPLGSVIFPLPLEQIDNEKVQKELQNWIDYTSDVYDLEEKILDKIEDASLKQLTISVDTNPKYILSALSRLKVCKASGLHSSKSWEEMENLLTLIFHYLFTSDIKHGGGKQKGEAVTDNMFFVEKNKDEIIAGIVDSKCSFNADLSKEKTEKYENYFKKVRQLRWPIAKKALIFVVLDTKSEYTIKEFFGRLKKKIEKGEYVIILPINSLELILYTYLGIILRGRINLNKSDFTDLIEKLFDIDFIDGYKQCKIENNLYRLPADLIFEELKKRAESPSSLELAFKEIFE